MTTVLPTAPESIRRSLDDMERDATRRRIRQLHRARKAGEVAAYMDGLHVFVLRGWDGRAVGEPVSMTGREAWQKNRALEKEFFRTCSRKPTLRLSRWLLRAGGNVANEP